MRAQTFEALRTVTETRFAAQWIRESLKGTFLQKYAGQDLAYIGGILEPYLPGDFGEDHEYVRKNGSRRIVSARAAIIEGQLRRQVEDAVKKADSESSNRIERAIARLWDDYEAKRIGMNALEIGARQILIGAEALSETAREPAVIFYADVQSLRAYELFDYMRAWGYEAPQVFLPEDVFKTRLRPASDRARSLARTRPPRRISAPPALDIMRHARAKNVDLLSADFRRHAANFFDAPMEFQIAPNKILRIDNPQLIEAAFVAALQTAANDCIDSEPGLLGTDADKIQFIANRFAALLPAKLGKEFGLDVDEVGYFATSYGATVRANHFQALQYKIADWLKDNLYAPIW